MATSKVQRFDAAMHDIYTKAKDEVGYNATRFKQMLSKKGGLETARHLLAGHPTTVSEGFTQLALKGRLDLTVEALVLASEWKELFTSEEISNATRRLK